MNINKFGTFVRYNYKQVRIKKVVEYLQRKSKEFYINKKIYKNKIYKNKNWVKKKKYKINLIIDYKVQEIHFMILVYCILLYVDH